MKMGIINYGAGNLRSVQKAVETCGAQAEIVEKSHEFDSMDKLILPGVGAFGQAMNALSALNLVEAIKEKILDQTPFLGICLGYQLLFEESEESPGVKGLSVFPGRVRRFRGNLKIPHLGWNEVYKSNRTPLWNDINDGAFFYFAHSFYVNPADSDMILARCEYGETFAAAAGNEYVFGMQFHPEKSQSNGLRILKNFVKL